MRCWVRIRREKKVGREGRVSPSLSHFWLPWFSSLPWTSITWWWWWLFSLSCLLRLLYPISSIVFFPAILSLSSNRHTQALLSCQLSFLTDVLVSFFSSILSLSLVYLRSMMPPAVERECVCCLPFNRNREKWEEEEFNVGKRITCTSCRKSKLEERGWRRRNRESFPHLEHQSFSLSPLLLCLPRHELSRLPPSGSEEPKIHSLFPILLHRLPVKLASRPVGET